MSISAALQRSLFKDKDGGAGALTSIIKHRFLSFLIWQALQSTLLLFLSKTILLSPFSGNPFSPTFQSPVYFVSFHLSLLIIAVSLFFVSSPHPLPFATPFELSLSFIRLIFVSGGEQSILRRRVRVSLSFVLFVCLCGVAGAVSLISVCWGCSVYYDVDLGSNRVGALGNLGFRGFVIGLVYGFHYVYKQRWVFRFPIIQRPPFFSYKMGLPLSIGRALRFSAVGYALSGVLHTKRFVFAPPKGSAAAETNPSEPLLATIEESTPNSLLQYLAYLDLCMVCKNNVDTRRRAAFFEETGETYRRVIAACLRPLEQFTQKLAEGLESSSAEKSMQLSDQLTSPTERLAVLKLY